MTIYIELSGHIAKDEDKECEAPDMQRALHILQFEYNAGFRTFFLQVE